MRYRAFAAASGQVVEGAATAWCSNSFLPAAQGCLIGLNLFETSTDLSRSLSGHAAMPVEFNRVIRHHHLPFVVCRRSRWAEDYINACAWFLLAIKTLHGVHRHRALSGFDDVSSHLIPAQLAKARCFAVSWKPNRQKKAATARSPKSP